MFNHNLKAYQVDKNDWKFEFSLFKEGMKFLRGKIYNKTAEKLTSLGV